MGRRGACLLVAGAMLLSACVPGDAPTAVVATDQARTGGELTVAIARPGAIDPANAFDPSAELIARTMCDTLLTTDPVTGELRPGLAESWLVTDEGRQVVLRLRPDAVFTDGEPVTARDVVASLSRAASPEFAGELAGLLQPIAGWDELRGVVETDVARHRRELAGVSAVGEHAVQVAFRAPGADHLGLFSHPVTAPVSTVAVEADPEAFPRQPVCVGPYVVSEPWTRNADRIVLARSDAYDGAEPTATRGGRGWVDRIVFQVVAEQPEPADTDERTVDDEPSESAPPVPQVAAPSLRGIDVAPVAPEHRDEIHARPAMEVIDVPGPGVDYVGVPVPAVDDETSRLVREALSLAIDRAAVADAVGGRVPATRLLPPTVGPAFRGDACAQAPAAGDAEAARARLRASGQQLTSLRLVTTDEFRNLAVAQAVAASWEAALDVAVEVEVVTWPELDRRTGSAQGIDAPFRTSWSVPYPSADAYLRALAHSSRIGTTNATRFSDPATDERLDDDAATAVDREDTVLELQRVEDRLCEHLPVLPVVRELRSWALRTSEVVAARADGVRVDAATALPRLRDLYLRP